MEILIEFCISMFLPLMVLIIKIAWNISFSLWTEEAFMKVSTTIESFVLPGVVSMLRHVKKRYIIYSPF